MGVIANKASIDKLRKALEEVSTTATAAGTAATAAGTAATAANTAITTLHPDGNSIVLNSSTESSTKRFSITVNDSGELSATEITTGEPPLPSEPETT